jgi:hypothetical protein
MPTCGSFHRKPRADPGAYGAGDHVENLAVIGQSQKSVREALGREQRAAIRGA